MEKERESGDEDEMGVEDILILNPPVLDRHDVFVWNWYWDNVNAFVGDFNLMPHLIERLGLKDLELTLFLMKMNLVYQHRRRLAEQIRTRESGEGNA